MLSASETSHNSICSQTGDPSLMLPVYASLRDRQDDATEMCGVVKAERAGRFVFRLSLLVFRAFR